MGLFGALTASVSGLAAQGQAISVISDNLANTNTVGYKASRALFSQLVTSSGVSGTEYNAGGLSTNVRRDQGTQGSLTASDSVTDMAISGNGFFRVADSKNISTDTTYYYTRNGAFTEDKEGFLTNAQGYYLQGWRTDSEGDIANLQDLVNIELQSVGVSAQETRNVALGLNLDSTEAPLTTLYDTTGSLSSSLTNIRDSGNAGVYLTDVRVYDSQGTARDVTFAFSKRANNLWDWQVYTDGSNIQGGTAGDKVTIGQGTLEFNSNGSLKYATSADPTTGATIPNAAGGVVVTANWSGGVTPSDIVFNMGSFNGGSVVTATTNMDYTDGVYATSIEGGTLADGTYRLQFMDDAGTVNVLNAANVVVASGTIPTTATNREVVLTGTGTNPNIRMTFSATFDAQPGGVGPGVYPDTSDQFVVTNEAAQGAGLANDGVIQFASSFNTSFTNQDGFASGNLASIQIDENGFVSGTFTNGETKKLYKVALAVFQDPGGLETISGSLLRVTDVSGQALIKQAGNAGTGRIVSGVLEGSTTDIANEFSQMIVAQRAFQANSTVITTVDQMLNSLLQLR
jgi:flagellar hook protein FlgE